MTVVLTCPCGHRLAFPEGTSGLLGECPVCSRQFTIRSSFAWVKILAAIAGLGLCAAFVSSRMKEPPPQAAAPDDGGNDFASATLVNVAGDATSVTQAGQLETQLDADVYRIPGTDLTTLSVKLQRPTGSSAAAKVAVFDAQQVQLHSTELASGAPDVELPLALANGKDLFVKVEAAGEIGAYELVLRGSTDIGDTPETAIPLELEANGEVTINGKLEMVGDVDLFRCVAPATGMWTVSQRAANGDPLDSVLQVLDQELSLLNENDDSLSSRDAQLTVSVEEGSTYFLRAAALTGSADPANTSNRVGAYTLTIVSLPGASPSNEEFTRGPQTLEVFPQSAAQAGSISSTGEQDQYYVDAPVTGFMTARIETLGSGEFRGGIRIEDQYASILGSTEPYSTERSVTAFVTAGSRYIVRALAEPYDPGDVVVGDYLLRVTFAGDDAPADVPDSTFDAVELVLRYDGGASYESRIESPGDVDMYRITAPADGEMSVALGVRGVGLFDGMLTVLDANESSIVSANDRGFGDGENVHWLGSTGVTYYLRVSASDAFGIGAMGDYRLDVTSSSGPTTADIPEDFANAGLLTFDDRGVASVDGRIDFQGDKDLYRFTAPGSGTATFRLVAQPASAIDPELTLYGAQQDYLTYNDDDALTLDSKLTYDLVAGVDYYVRAQCRTGMSSTASIGNYQLTIERSSTESAMDDFGNTRLDAHDVTLDLHDEGVANITGRLDSSGDVDSFWFQAQRQSECTVRLATGASGVLSAQLTVHGPLGPQSIVGDMQGDPAPADQITLMTSVDEVYFLQVAPLSPETTPATYDLMIEYRPGPLETSAEVGLGKGKETAAAPLLNWCKPARLKLAFR